MAVTEAEKQTAVGYLTLLRTNHNYRSIWLGEVISLFGDWFNLIASASLVSHLTQSGLAVGGLFVVRMLAPFLVSPFAGVAADRYNRKHLLILSDLSRAVVVMGFLLVRNANQVWLLYTLSAIQLAISGIFFPARNAILPDIVSRRELGAAVALSSATWSVMLAFGAAIGGVVAGEWGIYPAFVVDSLSFLFSALFISQVVYAHTAAITESGHSIRAAYDQYIEGLRYLRHDLDVFAIAMQKGAVALTVNGVFQVIQVILAERVFVMGEGGGTSLGLLYAVAGVGTGIGPILVRKYIGDKDRSLRIALAFSYLIIMVGLAITAPLASFGMVLFGTFVRTFGSGMNWVFSTTLLIENVSDRVRGRVFSSEFAIFTLASAISTGAGGWILDNTSLSVSNLIWLVTACVAIPGGLWCLWIMKNHRPGLQEEEPGS